MTFFKLLVECARAKFRVKQKQGNLLTRGPPSPNRALDMRSPTQAALFIGVAQLICAHQF